jgi:hypothetical protein
MKNRLLLALAVILGFVAVGHGSDWRKDPDIAVDPANVVASNLLLLAPQPTTAETLDTLFGPGTDIVGIDETALAATPPASSSGALFVDDDHSDCPNAPFTTISSRGRCLGAQ